MTVCNAGFELGVTGATVATSDRGDGNAWDSLLIQSSAGLTYDTTHSALGAQAAKYAPAGTNGICYLAWSTKMGTLTEQYGRLYLWLASAPSAIHTIMVCRTGGAQACALKLNTTSKIRCHDAADTNLGTFTNAITTGQWVRIEWHVIHSATVGTFEVKLFNTATSGVATETVSITPGALNTGANVDEIRFGVSASVTSAAFWMDQIQAGATAYPGVHPVGLPRGALSGVGA